MIIAFTPTGWEDYQYWQSIDQRLLEKVNELIENIAGDPFRGLGKPEALRGNLTGYWSRRISGEHRIVYSVSGSHPNQTLTIIAARFHYR
jgi:toxin YoeB